MSGGTLTGQVFVCEAHYRPGIRCSIGSPGADRPLVSDTSSARLAFVLLSYLLDHISHVLSQFCWPGDSNIC